MSRICEKASEAVLRQVKDCKQKDCYIVLHHTTLLIFADVSLKKPLHVICLEGLAVTAVEVKDLFGFEIRHRDGIYPERQLLFPTKAQQEEWLESLASFKGESIQEKYNFIEKIGMGKFSIVYRAVRNHTNEEVAIKVIEVYKLTPEERNQIAYAFGNAVTKPAS